jgi:four helix bundle protein
MTTDSAMTIRERAFVFGCAVARLALSVASRPGVRVLVDQLLKAGTAIGANLEEAKAASSRREFVRYVEISLREARETLYWLRIWVALDLAPCVPRQGIAGRGRPDCPNTHNDSCEYQTSHRLRVCILHSEFCITDFLTAHKIIFLNAPALVLLTISAVPSVSVTR